MEGFDRQEEERRVQDLKLEAWLREHVQALARSYAVEAALDECEDVEETADGHLLVPVILRVRKEDVEWTR